MTSLDVPCTFVPCLAYRNRWRRVVGVVRLLPSEASFFSPSALMAMLQKILHDSTIPEVLARSGTDLNLQSFSYKTIFRALWDSNTYHRWSDRQHFHRPQQLVASNSTLKYCSKSEIEDQLLCPILNCVVNDKSRYQFSLNRKQFSPNFLNMRTFLYFTSLRSEWLGFDSRFSSTASIYHLLGPPANKAAGAWIWHLTSRVKISVELYLHASKHINCLVILCI